MNGKTLLLATVLLAFGAYSTTLVLDEGYFGFLTLAMREGWALQMLLDVGIAVGILVTWMIPDARSRGITVWPYVVASLGLGSIGVLAYLLRREWAGKRETAAPATA